MLFSPIDPLWVGLIVLVLFVLIYGLCYCLCVEAVKTGQKILAEQQETMSKEEKGLKGKKKKERLLQSEKAETSLSSSESETEEELERLAKRVEKPNCTLTWLSKKGRSQRKREIRMRKKTQ